MPEITLCIPWPPSVNHYWGRRGHRSFISKKGLEYRAQVATEVRAQKADLHLTQRLMLFIAASPPDRRRRDIDNALKCPIDALQHAGVFCDDEQIDVLSIMRLPNQHGQLFVRLISVGEATRLSEARIK